MSEDPWLAVLSKLNLSRAELAAVRRFSQDSLGRSFLPVADILRAHKKTDESLELLTQGVERHPGFTVARVVLARELLGKGMVAQAWFTLESSPQSLDDNVLAQKLKLKLAVLSLLEENAHNTARHMYLHQMHDEDTRALAEMLKVAPLVKVRDRLAGEMRALGIELLLPEAEEVSKSDKANTGEDRGGHETAPQISGASAEDEELYQKLQAFHVLPLQEVFKGMELGHGSEVTGSGVELDSTTLADLYGRQGHYNKALAIYRRLLRMTPHSDFLKRKIRDLSQQEKQQRQEDLSVDPTLVDQMEAIEIVDVQANFFEKLLQKLEAEPWRNR